MLIRSFRIVSIVGALTFAGFVATTDAEPIAVTITSGSASFNIEGGKIAVVGTDGFSLTGFLDNTVIPSEYCCVGLAPGTSTTFQANFIGPDVYFAEVTFQGDTFSDVGKPPNFASLSFLSSPFTVPTSDAGFLRIPVPFTLTGTFTGTRDASQPPLELSLVGSGMGMLDLVRTQSTWFGFGGSFEFAGPLEVTPEPGTLALLGLALAGACGARRLRS
jgi:hypothetical protein